MLLFAILSVFSGLGLILLALARISCTRLALIWLALALLRLRKDKLALNQRTQLALLSPVLLLSRMRLARLTLTG